MDEPRRYESVKQLIGVSKFVLDVAVLLFLLASGWSIRIRSFAQMLSGSNWLRVMIYMIIVGGLLKAIDLPFSYYSGYVLEHRFQLSRQSLTAWMKDQLKALAIAAPLTIAPVLLLPLFFKFKPVENPDLQNRVDRLARRTGKRICGIFEWSLGEKTRKANAAVVGWGNTRRIIVSDTLLKNFSGEEIEVVIAHELCHYVKNHIWYGMAAQSLFTFVAFYVAYRVLPPLSRSFGFSGTEDVANFPLMALVMTILSLAALPAVNCFSRRLETAADLYALDVTGDALAFVSSMEKLADINLVNKNPNKIVEFIFHSHPSVEDRVKLAADRVGQKCVEEL